MNVLEWMEIVPWKRIADDWPFKVFVSMILSVIGMHAMLMILFALVVSVDLLAKWISLSYRYLTERRIRNRDLWSCLVAIPLAQRAGVISSDEMKRCFCSKMIMYVVIVLGGALADIMMMTVGEVSVFVRLCIGYLVASEMVSIVENLQDAGVDVLSGLIRLFRMR